MCILLCVVNTYTCRLRYNTTCCLLVCSEWPPITNPIFATAIPIFCWMVDYTACTCTCSVICAVGDCLTPRPKGRSQPRELWFSIYPCQLHLSLSRSLPLSIAFKSVTMPPHLASTRSTHFYVCPHALLPRFSLLNANDAERHRDHCSRA